MLYILSLYNDSFLNCLIGESRPISISSFYEGAKRKQKVFLDDIGSPTQVIASFTGAYVF
jgi:hypothetical protein